MSVHNEHNGSKKITVSTFIKKKKQGEKIAVLTAYDYYTAKFLDRAGIDSLLVGDSAGMVVHGERSTLPVTMDIMIAHTRAVARGSTNALVIADMPFLSYQPSLETAITNAGRFLKEAYAEAVKIEGGIEMAATVKRLFECGIPVMGHIGHTPQSIHRFGGAKVKGRKEASKQYLLESAQALEEAGAFSMVLELIQTATASEITKLVHIPTIGIGSGKDCDGQVLVINDILGLYDEFKPKFVRRYADLSGIIEKAASAFINDVKTGSYPNDDESFE
ncbi:MAG: 3-methyl-2-oxobutanoate hydroxymethyltransferase [candidate division Zixibacteria bacterium HGW-Zixibacteria-1]|nr:MAG: 3-methyl-2-oxobutanoate hydroxymethyltransferase [candidate division Zixibacteria bacterium HGW-Zixibacteria-1]